jgi:hypothetical protein
MEVEGPPNPSENRPDPVDLVPASFDHAHIELREGDAKQKQKDYVPEFIPTARFKRF